MTRWRSHLLPPFLRALAAVVIGTSAASASAAICTYDDPAIARADVQEVLCGAAAFQQSEAFGENASRGPEAATRAYDSSRYLVATNATGGFSRGSNGLFGSNPIALKT